MAQITHLFYFKEYSSNILYHHLCRTQCLVQVLGPHTGSGSSEGAGISAHRLSLDLVWMPINNNRQVVGTLICMQAIVYPCFCAGLSLYIYTSGGKLKRG